jgi:hypothetical protein
VLLWQHFSEKFFGDFLLLFEFERLLFDQVLQVVCVLFNHLEHQIDYVHFSPMKLALRRLMCTVNIMRACPLSASYSKFKINFNNSVSCLRLKFDVQEKDCAELVRLSHQVMPKYSNYSMR